MSCGCFVECVHPRSGACSRPTRRETGSGINLVPRVLSEALFRRVLNFTIGSRQAVLRNGAASKEATALAAMPFAWILRTLLSDRVRFAANPALRGYLDAERAKLVFHSTRGISTLYFLAALGLTDGVEPPFANLLNVEIYSTPPSASAPSDGDAFDGFLFRILNMGAFLPFPGCEAEYGSEQAPSTLCSLSVLMRRLDELAMPLKQWEPHCAAITAEYFANDVDDAKETACAMVRGGRQQAGGLGVWLFGVGALSGALLMWLWHRASYLKRLFAREYEVVH